MTKWPAQKLTQGTTHKLLKQYDADIQKNLYFYVFRIFLFLFSFLLIIS